MIELVIDQRRKDLGGFEVGRVLPFAKRRMVGPFIFFDHMGPADFAAGFPRSVDVRPHPHIGLSTVTYLFDGEITHRDSVGVDPGDPPGRGQLDDRRPRHHPFRALRDPARRGRPDARHPGLGRPAHRAGGDRPQLRQPRPPTTCPPTRAAASGPA